MGTRLRPIVSFCGELRAGGNVRRSLEMWCKQFGTSCPPRGSMPDEQRLIQMFKALTADRPRPTYGEHFLWLFREPRRVTSSRSRYAQLCEHFGVAPQRTKKKKASIFRDGSLVSDQLARQLARERDQQRELMEQQIRAQQVQAVVNPLQNPVGEQLGRGGNFAWFNDPVTGRTGVTLPMGNWGQGATWGTIGNPAATTTTTPPPQPPAEDLDWEYSIPDIEP
jgi:hypothetical protein